MFFRPEFFLNPKNDLYRGNFMRGIYCNHAQSLKMIPRSRKVGVHIKAKNTNLHTYFPESRSGKHFQASGMRNRFSA
jgi:hypothetical protein